MVAEKDRSLNGLRSEQEKLQGRLMSANADRSASLARCAQLEQQINDQHKSMDTLQKQVSVLCDLWIVVPTCNMTCNGDNGRCSNFLSIALVVDRTH